MASIKDRIKDGMVFQSSGANLAAKGPREIVVASVYPTLYQVVVRDLRTGNGWRMDLLSLEDAQKWQYSGVNAWETVTV